MIIISFENRSLSASSHPKEHRDLSLLRPEFHEEQAADEPRLPDATVREVIAPTSQYYHILLHSMNFVRHINSSLNLISSHLLLRFLSDPSSMIVYPFHIKNIHTVHTSMLNFLELQMKITSDAVSIWGLLKTIAYFI